MRLDVLVGDQVGGEALAVGQLAAEQPAHVRVAAGPWSGPRRSRRTATASAGRPRGRQNAWWRRWSATHCDRGRPRSPASRRPPGRSAAGRLALNEPWVRYRWKPVPMPRPAIDVEDDGHRDVDPGEPPAPGDRDRGDQRRERQGHEGPERDQDAGGLRALGQWLGACGEMGVFSRTGVDMAPRRVLGEIDSYAYVTVTYATVTRTDAVLLSVHSHGHVADKPSH